MNGMRKTEDRHHSPEQVHEYIEQAIVLLNAQTLTAGQRERLLPVVVTLLSAKQVFYEQAMPIPDLNALKGRH